MAKPGNIIPVLPGIATIAIKYDSDVSWRILLFQLPIKKELIEPVHGTGEIQLDIHSAV
jgi:hypothetical protein